MVWNNMIGPFAKPKLDRYMFSPLWICSRDSAAMTEMGANRSFEGLCEGLGAGSVLDGAGGADVLDVLG